MNRVVIGWIVAFVSVLAVGGQERDAEIVVEPERVRGEVAPVAVVVGELPVLPPVPMAEELFDREVALVTIPQDELRPPGIPRDSLSAVQIATRDEQIYFNATLGGGSVNSVLGSINVFRLGEGPQFRLGYDQRSSDGFGFNDPGTGFNSSVNTIDTWLRLDGETAEGETSAATLEIEALYRDARDGLQGQPVWYAAEMRTLSGLVRGEIRNGSRSSAYVDLGIHDNQRVLSAIDPNVRSPLEAYRQIRPALGGVIEWPRFRIEGETWYDGRFLAGSGPDGNELRPASRVGVDLGLEGVVVPGFTLRGTVGSVYRFGDGALFPASAGISLSGSDRWSFDIDGGFRVDELNVAELWTQYTVPAMAGSTQRTLPAQRELFGDAALGIALVPQVMELDAAVSWAEREADVLIGEYDETTGLFPMTFDTRSVLDSELGLSVQLSESLSIRGGLRSRWADRDFGIPTQEAVASGRVELGRVASELALSAPVSEESILPMVGFTVDYGLPSDVDLQFFGSDLLGPLEERGRTRQGSVAGETNPFITPGFELGLSIRVSF